MSNTVNIFNYEQEENRFTNGLFAILELSRREHPSFAKAFLRDLLSLEPSGKGWTYCVLRIKGAFADAELGCKGCCVRFETKIRSGKLSTGQVRRRLKELGECPQRLKRLVLLTPDDGKSAYVKRFLNLDDGRVLHLGWRKVYDWLKHYCSKSKETVFSQIVCQFLELIHDCVFNQDMAGIITKIDFGNNSGVDPDTYIEEMRRGEWDGWNTPREYKNLDGTGRKLLFYDTKQKGITAEVEIKKVSFSARRQKWCWQNLFVPGTLSVFDKPIPLSHIRSIDGFDHFSQYRKDRSPYRNITREQYQQLMENGKTK